jgi:hypothetical protein
MEREVVRSIPNNRFIRRCVCFGCKAFSGYYLWSPLISESERVGFCERECFVHPRVRGD